MSEDHLRRPVGIWTLCEHCIDALDGLRPAHDCLGYGDVWCPCACPDLTGEDRR